MKQTKRVDDSNKPSWRWKDRFHRSNPPFGLGVASYVSRPTFDLLRSSSHNGKCAYYAIMEFLKYSTGDLKEPIMGRQWSDDDQKLTSFSFVMGKDDYQSLVILLGPFNVANEMNFCSQGFMLHAIPITDQENLSVSNKGLKPLRIREEFDKGQPFYELDTGEHNPAEMFEPWFANVIDEQYYNNMSKDSMDFAAARLLPTDLFIQLANSDQNQSHAMAKTRAFLSRQFNEIRLLDDVTKANLEQIQAIDMYKHSKSSAINISGRPGVGKSTILHIDACEALLQRGSLRGERKLLYLAATTELIEEAKSEIFDMLQYLYFWKSKDSKAETEKLFSNIHFAVEEDFFLQEPGSLGPLSDFGLFREIVKKTDDDPLWNYWKEDANLRYLQRILQNFVYGVFGSPSDFCNWIPNGPVEALIQRFEEPFNFYNPGRKFIPDNSDSLSSDFFATYFWDPGFRKLKDDQNDQKRLAKRVRGLAAFISRGGLGDHLVDYSINKYTGMYDTGSVVHKTAKSLFALEKPLHTLESIQESKLWLQVLNRGYDVILVDESQDFSALSISTMLQYFSNRGVHRESNHAPFSFVCAGDEFQTIHGTLFQGAMIHINKIYTDWKMLLREQSTDDFNLLSDDLPNPIKLVLRASYRTSDLQTEILDNIVKTMRHIAVNEGHRRSVSISTYGIRRLGVVAGLPRADTVGDTDNCLNWLQVMQELLQQLERMGEPDAAPKVAFIFPVTRIKTFGGIIEQFDNFLNLNPHEDIAEIIEKMKKCIKKKYNDTKKKLTHGGSSDADLNFVSMMKEAGFCDIRGIKGLTVPVAVTLNPPVKVDQNRRWFETMRELSLSLVMISRSQFGLFLAAPDEIVELTTGDTLWNELNNSDGNGLMHSSLPPSDKFADRLTNSSPSEIAPKSLFNFATKEWYLERGWVRLERSALLEHEQRELISKLKQIFIGIRTNGIAVYDRIEDLIDFREKAEKVVDIFALRDYFSTAARDQLQWFLLWQDLCKKTLEGADKREKKYLIERIENFFEDIMADSDEQHPAGNIKSREFISCLFGDNTGSMLSDLDHPWNTKFQSDQPLHTQDIDLAPPRFFTGSWKLSAPPNTEIEEREFWIQKGVYWAPPVVVLREILAVSPQESQVMDWAIDWIEQNPQSIMKKALLAYEKGDPSYLFWTLRIVFSAGESSPNYGQYIHQGIEEYLIHEIPRNKILCDGLANWIEQKSTCAEIEDGIEFISQLYRGKDKFALRESKRVFTEHLDGTRIFKSWLKHSNVRHSNNAVIHNNILKLVKGRLRDVLIGLQALNSHFSKDSKMESFLKSAFKIRYDVVKTLETENSIQDSGLERLWVRIYERVLSDNTRLGEFQLGGRRQGEMYGAGLRINPHFRSHNSDLEDWSFESGLRMKKPKHKKVPCQGGYVTSYDREVEMFTCSKCSQSNGKPIPIDSGLLWYKSFVENHTSLQTSNNYLTRMVLSHLSSSIERNSEIVVRQLREGKRDYNHIFISKEALVLELARKSKSGSDGWRRGGHLFNWAAKEGSSKIPRIATQRFDSLDFIREIGINGKTFSGYLEFYNSLEGGPDFTHGDLDLSKVVTSFVEGGAITEAQAIFLANFPLGQTDGEYIEHYAHSMHLEGLIYQEHVGGRDSSKSIMPFTGNHQLNYPVDRLYGDLSTLPRSIQDEIHASFAEHGALTRDGKVILSVETKYPAFFRTWISPYLQRMNVYLAISYAAKQFETIGNSSEALQPEANEFILQQLSIVPSSLEGKFFTADAFNQPSTLTPSPNRTGSNPSFRDAKAVNSDGVLMPEELFSKVNDILNQKIKTFVSLLKAYRAVKYIAGEDYDEMARETYAKEVFRILGADGLSNVMEAAAQTKEWYVPEVEVTSDLEEAVLSSSDARVFLEHYLREKYGLTDKMITMFLGEVERGKPELDRMLDESNEQIWGAYQALLNHSNEEE
jgi:hypothetical protein